jgi:hypothetical protein
MHNEITYEQAYLNIEGVVREYKGTAKDHEILAECLKKIKFLVDDKMKRLKD